jgi:hypothetical protein
MQGNLHVPFLGGWAGAIPPGYPADEETGRKVLRLVLTQHHHTGVVLAYVFGRRKDAVFLGYPCKAGQCRINQVL